MRKPFQTTLALLVTLMLNAFLLVSSKAGTFSSDFNAGAPAGATLVGDAAADAGVLKLTDLGDGSQLPKLPQKGALIIEDFDGGKKIGAFTARFKARVGGGTETPAQGFSFCFANDLSSDTAIGEGGGGTGLIVSFDTVDNLAGFGADGNDPGDAPGVIVKFGGAKVAAKNVPLSVLRTGAAFVNVEISVTADGKLSVKYGNTQVYDNYSFGWAPLSGRWGFGAGTAELTAAIRDNHWIDDLSITTTPVSGAYVSSVLPAGQGARPDAVVHIELQSLPNQTVSLDFNGAKVTPRVTASGATTTVEYASPTLLASGSTNSVKLTYDTTKTLQYSFVVVNYPTLTAESAVTVDTTKAGFKVRAFQTEQRAIADLATAEKVLAGQGGPNIATPPVAADEPDQINYEVNGAEAGSVPGEKLYPGIPGTLADGTSTQNNFALEAITYLDLQPGAYTFGVNSDDGFRLTAGVDPRDAFAVTLGQFDGGRGAADSLFTFVVATAGRYPFRLVQFQGTGGASVEWFSVSGTGTRTLINGAGGIKAYRERPAGTKLAPYASAVNPTPGESKVSLKPKITLVITDDATTLDPASIQLSLNGTAIAASNLTISKKDKDTTVTYQVGANLSGETAQALHLVYKDNANNTVTRDWRFTTTKSAGATVVNPVKAQWDFDKGDLKATLGTDLAIDSSVASLYKYGTTTSFGIPNINGKVASVLHVPFTETDDAKTFRKIWLRVKNPIAPNGAANATRVNQWTLIMDVLWGNDGPSGFGSVLQTHDLDNPTDGDMFWRASDGSYGKGCCSNYDGIDPNRNHKRGEWARVVFSVDLAARPPVFAKYVNGALHRKDVGGDGASLNSRFALPAEFNLFGDGDDNERTDAYVNSIQLREGRMTDEEVAALGGPSADGVLIPISVMQWDFDNGDLKATTGPDLTIDPTVASLYKYGTTTSFGIPDISGKPAKVIHIPFMETDDARTFRKIWLRVKNLIPANGAPTATRVNQWTMIMDVLWGNDGPSGFGSVLQTHDLDNPTDGDMFWRASDGSYGKGCCSNYDGIDPNRNHKRGEWARVVFAVDLAANPPVFAKYVNGALHRKDVGGDGASLNSRFALPAEFNLFGDGDDNERTDAYVNSIQIRTGRLSDEEIVALGGASSDGIPLPGAQPSSPIKAQWDFDNGDLKATIGPDLTLDTSVASLYKYGTTTSFGIPNINGQAAQVIHVPFTETDDARTFRKIWLRVKNPIAPNGAANATRVNQWTLIMDVLWGNDGPSGFGSVLQTHDLDNPTDGDMFWRASDGSYGKGCCSNYDGIDPNRNHKRGEWARVVYAVDLAATPPVFAKYVNGALHRKDVGGDGASLNSRFALPAEFNLFGDGDDNERTDAYVNSIQLREGRMTDEEVAALGGPSADGIPGVSSTVEPPTPAAPKISVGRSGGNLTISWPASASGYTLQVSDNLVSPNWTAVTGVVNNSINIPIGATTKFYRLRK